MPIQMRMDSRTFPAFAALMAAAVVSACATTSGVRPEAFPRSQPANEANLSAPAPGPAAVVTPSPVVVSAASPTAGAIQTALSLLGTPYRFGGESPDTGFDCSGFVGYVLRQHSIALPRTVECWRR